MKTNKEDMLKTYNEFKALCLDKGYEFKFEGIQPYVNANYAVLNIFNKTGSAMNLTAWEQGDVMSTMKELYQKGIDNLIKYG